MIKGAINATVDRLNQSELAYTAAIAHPVLNDADIQELASKVERLFHSGTRKERLATYMCSEVFIQNVESRYKTAVAKLSWIERAKHKVKVIARGVAAYAGYSMLKNTELDEYIKLSLLEAIPSGEFGGIMASSLMTKMVGM